MDERIKAVRRTSLLLVVLSAFTLQMFVEYRESVSRFRGLKSHWSIYSILTLLNELERKHGVDASTTVLRESDDESPPEVLGESVPIRLTCVSGRSGNCDCVWPSVRESCSSELGLCFIVGGPLEPGSREPALKDYSDDFQEIAESKYVVDHCAFGVVVSDMRGTEESQAANSLVLFFRTNEGDDSFVQKGLGSDLNRSLKPRRLC